MEKSPYLYIGLYSPQISTVVVRRVLSLQQIGLFQLALSLFLAATGVNAKVTLPHYLTSGMVMQQHSQLTIKGSAKAGVTVRIAPSWAAHNSAKPTSKAILGFILTDQAGQWVQASATQRDARTIVLSSPDIKSPKAARYDWADYPNGNLYGETGLPVTPFKTDK